MEADKSKTESAKMAEVERRVESELERVLTYYYGRLERMLISYFKGAINRLAIYTGIDPEIEIIKRRWVRSPFERDGIELVVRVIVPSSEQDKIKRVIWSILAGGEEGKGLAPDALYRLVKASIRDLRPK